MLEVQQCGSINKAAQNLYISQPALSRALRELEAEIGITLFVRSRTGIITTHQGNKFLEQAKRLNEQFISFRDQYYDHRASHVLTLSVSSVRYSVVGRALTNFYNHHTDCKLQNISVCEASGDEVIQQVYDGRHTLGFLLIPSDSLSFWKQKAELCNLSWIPLSSQGTYVQLGTQHPLARQSSIHVADLKEFPRVTMSSTDVSSALPCSDNLGYNEKISKKRIVINDKSTCFEILTHTDAYYIGANLADISPRPKDICYIPLADAGHTLEFILIHLRRHQLTKTENEFIHELESVIQHIDSFS